LLLRYLLHGAQILQWNNTNAKSQKNTKSNPKIKIFIEYTLRMLTY